MSYIPDYRKETDKLTPIDRAYVEGYRAAMEDADSFFDNLDMYDASESEAEVLSNSRDCFNDWMSMEETNTVLSVFESGSYDGLELIDGNKPIFKNTIGAKKE